MLCSWSFSRWSNSNRNLMLTCQAVALAACACARWESGRAGIARSEGRLREALPGGVVCLQHFQLCCHGQNPCASCDLRGLDQQSTPGLSPYESCQLKAHSRWFFCRAALVRIQFRVADQTRNFCVACKLACSTADSRSELLNILSAAGAWHTCMQTRTT